MPGAELANSVRHGVELKPYNTLALAARAAHFVSVRQARGLENLAHDLGLSPDTPRFVLGGGSNLVLTQDFDGLMLHVNLLGRALLREDAEAWYLRVASGESWSEVVDWSLRQGWPGLENLALIPGTVGAAPIQNIGAYGLELSERFYALEAFDFVLGKWVSFDRAACAFAYRSSVFKQQGWHLDGRFLITSLILRLPKKWQAVNLYGDLAKALAQRNISTPSALDIAQAVIAIRQAKLPNPAEIPNVGSFFHNPVIAAEQAEQLLRQYPELPHYPQASAGVKLAAAWLIEQAGWKGKALGAVAMYERQALVLVNRGAARGSEVCALAQAVQADVQQRFGVLLTVEPVFL
ncbi:MAG: UDP-N-acetylmuramate dehydrogenase [Pseudomonadota bacterium]